MRVDKQLMDITVLDEGFGLSHLWEMRENLLELQAGLREQKETAIYLGRLSMAAKHEEQLYYVNGNLEIVEQVMSHKELDILVLTEYGEVCLN